MRPTATLSEFEYLYSEPGGKRSGSSSTKASSRRGGGALPGDALIAFWASGESRNSGSPLVWLRSSRSVTACQAVGMSGRRWPIVWSRPRTPRCTSASAAPPLNAFATLAIFMWSFARGGPAAPRRAAPAAWTVTSPPRWTIEIAPEGPPLVVTRAWSARSSAASASPAVGEGAATAGAAAPMTRTRARAETAPRSPDTRATLSRPPGRREGRHDAVLGRAGTRPPARRAVGGGDSRGGRRRLLAPRRWHRRPGPPSAPRGGAGVALDPGPAQRAHTIAANRSDTPRGRGLSRHGPAANAQARRYLSQRRRPLPADPIALALSGDLGVAVDRSLALEALRRLEAARAELERRRIAAVRRRLKGGR